MLETNMDYYQQETMYDDETYNRNGDCNRSVAKERVTSDLMAKWLFLLLLIIVGGSALSHGLNGCVASLSRPRNYQGLICGWDQTVKNLPFLYYPIDPKSGTKLMSDRGMCVARCPSVQDVASKGFIGVSEASVVQDEARSSFLSALHSVRSPLYATEPSDLSHGLCVPQSGPVRFQVEKISLGGPSLKFLRSLALGFYRASSLTIFFFISMPILSMVLVIMAYAAPTGTVATCLLSSVGLLGAYALRLFTTRDAATHESHFVSALTCLAAFIGIVSWAVHNKLYIEQSLDLMKCMREINDTQIIRHIAGCSLALQIVAVFLATCSVYTFALSQTNLASGTSPLEASLDPNGGIQIYGLTRISKTTDSKLSAVFILLLCTWSLEALLTTSRFVSAYTTLYYYLSGVYAYETSEREIEKGSALRALTITAADIPGSVLLLSVFRFVSRPMRVLFMTSTAARHQTRLDDHCLEPLEKHAKTTGRNMTHLVCDTIHNGVVVELIGHSENAGNERGVSATVCLSKAFERCSRVEHKSSSRLIGLSSFVSWILLLFVFVVTFVSTSYKLLTAHQGVSSRNSKYFIAHDHMITSLLVASICTAVAALSVCALIDQVVDSLIYTTLLEVDARNSPGESLPMLHGSLAKINTVDKLRATLCPPFLGNFLNNYHQHYSEQVDLHDQHINKIQIEAAVDAAQRLGHQREAVY